MARSACSSTDTVADPREIELQVSLRSLLQRATSSRKTTPHLLSVWKRFGTFVCEETEALDTLDVSSHFKVARRAFGFVVRALYGSRLSSSRGRSLSARR
jgi:hypothetical protein